MTAQASVHFTNRQLRQLIAPLFVEQLLIMLVGFADTLMISFAGAEAASEAAVSGVTLVNMFNTIFVYLFQALASGGAVVVSQYIGSQSREDGSDAAGQLTQMAFLLSTVAMALVLALQSQLFDVFFPRIEPEVRQAGLVYLRISAYSYPALALYNAGAALYRSMGRTSAVMVVSVLMNLINILGNAVGVFGLNAGVAGVAWASLIARVFAAVAMTALCFQRANVVSLRWKRIIARQPRMMKRIMGIALPNAVENGLFQLAKVALSTIAALFGTSQIAANGVAHSIWNIAALMGVSLGPAYITVIGQCMGAGDHDAACGYMKRLTRITLALSVGWNVFTLVMTVPILMLYQMPAETKRLVFLLVLIHNAFNSLVYPFAGPLANGLRAAGDVRYTMRVTTLSTAVRVALSLLFGIGFGMGVIGIAFAMVADWCLKGALFYRRFRSGKWLQFSVI